MGVMIVRSENSRREQKYVLHCLNKTGSMPHKLVRADELKLLVDRMSMVDFSKMLVEIL